MAFPPPPTLTLSVPDSFSQTARAVTTAGIFGIVLGSVVFFILIVVVVWAWKRYTKKRRHRSNQVELHHVHRSRSPRYRQHELSAMNLYGSHGMKRI
ncbi:hypothetical protein F4776DRAFT_611443 [Hypoxylon sp. NC0597]|nr:hypothetical protein F4776DRAFT_611443 [Hypoxylon sp. NC0597]